MTLGVMSLIFEGVVAALLVAVIVYAIKLNGRILALRTQESDLKEMIALFNDAATQAGQSAEHLKTVGLDSERNLRATIERAQAMRDDLFRAIESGGKMSDQVDYSVKRSQAAPPAEPVQTSVISKTEDLDHNELERKAEQAMEGLVDRFASQAEPSFWHAAIQKSSDNKDDTISLSDQSDHLEREHRFDDDPPRSDALTDPTPSVAPRVTAWTPGAASTAVAVEAPVQDDSKISRPEIEREMLKTMRISGVRR